MKTYDKHWFVWVILFLGMVGFSVALLTYKPIHKEIKLEFNEDMAMKYLEQQIAMGPRIPESQAHIDFIKWAKQHLKSNGWSTEEQHGVIQGHPLVNIIGKKGSGERIYFLTAHYDSRILADKDTSYPEVSLPVPGANDGASGVAVLMELSRVIEIPKDTQIWIVLFDIEDNGHLPGWEWILGSQYFVNNLTVLPDAVVNIDMVGDENLQIYPESTSTKYLTEQIWNLAKQMGYAEYFSTLRSHGIIDDHSPFLNIGIPAIDIIDFDYPHHHTLQDDLTHVSSVSLGIVGRVIERWVEEN